MKLKHYQISANWEPSVPISLRHFQYLAGDGNNNTVVGNMHGLGLHGQYNHVLGNHVHNIDNPGSVTAQTGCGIFGSPPTNHHISAQGLDSDHVSGNYAIAGHNEFSGNVIHDIGWPNTSGCNGSEGIYIGTPFGIFYNNILYRIGGAGLAMWHATTNMIASNNTLFQISATFNGIPLGSCISLGAGDAPGGVTSDHSTIVNNICRDSAAYSLNMSGTTGSNNFTSKMLIYNLGNSGNVFCHATNCTGFTSGQPPAGSIAANPLMVNFNANPGMPTVNASGQVVWPNADYHLQSGSPAINAGTTACASGVSSCTPTTDITGKIRTSPIDIGAYEQ